jgi:hypothetical protein
MKLFERNSQGFTLVYARHSCVVSWLGMVESNQVNAALDRILATPAFLRSPRLAQFLRFAVEQRLSGRTDAPKEIEVGVQVFGRGTDFDPRIDPVVRVQARLLRFKLHEYYETVGHDDPVLIDLPKGAYLPELSRTCSGSRKSSRMKGSTPLTGRPKPPPYLAESATLCIIWTLPTRSGRTTW